MTTGTAVAGKAVAAPTTGPQPRADGLPRRSRYFWGALGVFWAALVLSWTAGAFVYSKNLPLGLALTELLFFALPAGLFLRRYRDELSGLAPPAFTRPSGRVLAWAAVMAACVVCVAVAKGLSTRRSLGLDLTGGRTPVEFLVIVATLAPLCEELVMRPVLQRAFSLYWGPRASVLAAALLFALLHGSWLRLGETFVLGLFCGILFLKTGSYWACVLFHAVANAAGPPLFQLAFAGRIDWLVHPVTSVVLIAAASFAVWQLTPATDAPLRGLRQRLRWLFFGGGAATVRLAKTRAMAVAYWAGAGLLVVLLSAVLAAELKLYARNLLRVQGGVVEAETRPMTYPFEPTGGELRISVRADTATGSIAFEISDPDGRTLRQFSGAQMTVGNMKVPVAGRGVYTLKVTPRHASGHWEAEISER